MKPWKRLFENRLPSDLEFKNTGKVLAIKLEYGYYPDGEGYDERVYRYLREGGYSWTTDSGDKPKYLYFADNKFTGKTKEDAARLIADMSYDLYLKDDVDSQDTPILIGVEDLTSQETDPKLKDGLIIKLSKLYSDSEEKNKKEIEEIEEQLYQMGVLGKLPDGSYSEFIHKRDFDLYHKGTKWRESNDVEKFGTDYTPPKNRFPSYGDYIRFSLEELTSFVHKFDRFSLVKFISLLKRIKLSLMNTVEKLKEKVVMRLIQTSSL